MANEDHEHRNRDDNPEPAALAVEKEECEGSLRIYFKADEQTRKRLSEVGVQLIGGSHYIPLSHVDGSGEVRFAHLVAQTDYEVRFFPPNDLELESWRCTSVDERDAESKKIHDRSITVKPKPAREVELEVAIACKARELKVTAVYAPHDSKEEITLTDVRIRLFYDGRELFCGHTGQGGGLTHRLDKPGAYFLQAQSTVVSNSVIYKLAHPGEVMLPPQRSNDADISVKLRYSLALSEIVIGTNIRGAANSPNAQIAMLLLRDGDSNFSNLQTWSGSSVCWGDLPEDIYTFVVQETPALQLLHPREGVYRIKLNAGQQLDLTQYLQFKARTDDEVENVTPISGPVTDNGAPVKYKLIELVDATTKRTLMTSFTDASGAYSFFTSHSGPLEIRVCGRVESVPAAAQVVNTRGVVQSQSGSETDVESELLARSVLEAAL